ncbi:MAG: hypothetical protein IPI67_30105 [Myxococcales bacterium]|nr:hypothetical protein [Myxococcales bacterium]
MQFIPTTGEYRAQGQRRAASACQPAQPGEQAVALPEMGYGGPDGGIREEHGGYG